MHSEWSRRKFEDCVSLCRNGISYTNREESGGLPISRIQTISEGKIDLSKVGFSGLSHKESGTHLLEAGDILFSHINSAAHVGKVALLEDKHLPLIHGMNLLRLKPSEILSSGYLFFVLQSAEFRATVVSHSQVAVNQVSINIGSLKEIELLVPPVHIQRRIVDVVSSVDAYIDALQQQVDRARAARNAVLHQLLSAGGDDWTESTLGEIITLEYGKPLKAENRDGKGFPVFGSAGEVGLHSKPLVNEAPVIVVGRKGTAGAVWWSDLPCSVIDTAFYVVQKVETDIRFLYFILGYLDLPSLTAQTGVPGLNRDRAYSSQVLLPPLEEQKRIVEIVSCMDDVIQGTEQAVTDAKNLRSGLLSDLLSGEHEIPMSYDKFLKAA